MGDNNKKFSADQLLYGVAYYDEYMPYDRLDEDVRMMKEAGINVVRIAESTWSTLEPRDGEYNFYHIDRVLKAMGDAGISVIVGTPTYAIPPWMAKKYDDILIESGVDTAGGHKFYGARQIMDITHPGYLFHCERIIRVLMEHVRDYECVIGYQLDNETKHYGTACSRVQQMFFEHLKKKFNGDIEALNYEFGFAYWSNRVDTWDELPDVRGTINGSYEGEFEKFRRDLVDDFLGMQSRLVNEYKRPDQFVTHNFDFEWIGYSGGIQPDVNHFKTARHLTVAGCDIYHPTQDKLTGMEIAFFGDLVRSLKNDNYMVLETDVQGHYEWMPYDGQLRLQAFSHVANGADCVMYWHWHSLHNGCETYWKGLLSHDLKENDCYRDAKVIGAEFARHSENLLHLKKKNRVAIMVSNEALTGLRIFQLPSCTRYNEIVQWIYTALFEMNIECDFVPENAEVDVLKKYEMLFVPAMYSASVRTLENLKKYVADGGYLVSTFKTAFANENLKVYSDTHPYILSECFGVYYQHFTAANGARVVKADGTVVGDVRTMLECVNAIDETAPGFKVLANYDHPNWKKYIAAASNKYEKGTAVYIGCMTDKEFVKSLLEDCVKEVGLWTNKQQNAFPVINREGINMAGKKVNFYFNYSPETVKAVHWTENGAEILSGDSETTVCKGDLIEIEPWGVKIVIS